MYNTIKQWVTIFTLSSTLLIFQGCESQVETNPASKNPDKNRIETLSSDQLIDVTIPTGLKASSSANLVIFSEVIDFEDTLNPGNFVYFTAEYTVDTINGKIGSFKVNENFLNWLQSTHSLTMTDFLSTAESELAISFTDKPVVIPDPNDNVYPTTSKVKLCSESTKLRKILLGCAVKKLLTIPGGGNPTEICYRNIYNLAGRVIDQKEIPCIEVRQ